MGKMWDATNAKNIPSDAPIVAGYVNGRYQWSEEDWRRFPTAKLVRIQIFIPGKPNPVWNSADVLDVEAGDADRPDAQACIDAFIGVKRNQGKVPCIYTSVGMLPKVWRGKDVDYWLATLDGKERLIPGSCATQWVDTGPYDVSVTADWWPRDYSRPTQRGIPAMPNGSPVGIKLTPSGKGYLIVGSDGGTFNYGDMPQLTGLPALGVKPNAPVMAFDVTEDRQGLVMLGADWAVYATGSAEYVGHP